MSTQRKRTAVRLPEGRTVEVRDAGDVDLDTEIVVDREGRRITEADAERIAEETLAQIGPGRRSLTGQAKHSPRLSLRLRPDTLAALRARAEREGKPPTQLARELIEREVS